MRKHIVVIFLLIGLTAHAQSWDTEIQNYRDSLTKISLETGNNTLFKKYSDSLRQVVNTTIDDSVQVWALVELSNNYKYSRWDSAVFFARKAIDLASRLKMPKPEASARSYYLLTESAIGNHSKTLQLALENANFCKEHNLPGDLATSEMLIGYTYDKIGNYEKAKYQYMKTIRSYSGYPIVAFITHSYLAKSLAELQEEDSSLYYCQLVEVNTEMPSWVILLTHLSIARAYSILGYKEEALYYFNSAKINSQGAEELQYWLFEVDLEIARLYQNDDELDSAIAFGKEALSVAELSGFYSNIIDANLFLAGLYKSTDVEQALTYSENASQYKDSLSHMERIMAIDDFVSIDKAQRQSELDAARKDFQSRLKMNALMGSSFTLLVVAFVLFRSRRAKQKAKKNIEEAYDQLKSTQTQLIHSEKMASLGELTAGIAHEIQNPLNFVNNFSDVNKELLEELREEVKNGKRHEAEAIIKDIEDNEEKILHHGKRADTIVKGMLQHSRSGSSEKEPTDINALCDEYLRLAYHGLRAKDKSFNADFKTELDPNLPKINVVPQDIGRVLLNLINNAFFAVSQKSEDGSKDYKPEVILTTKLSPVQGGSRGVEISVKDNGPGIPDSIKDKIFQPFFTTKATGQGTGLGLSLSYDIIRKGHGGTIEAESQIGLGTEFKIIISL